MVGPIVWPDVHLVPGPDPLPPLQRLGHPPQDQVSSVLPTPGKIYRPAREKKIRPPRVKVFFKINFIFRVLIPEKSHFIPVKSEEDKSLVPF